ncbi:sigma-70 family RNA polymerase sigma factor [Rhizobium sp. NPDC090279]|uniref:sigma-70 family RNA polymerase sigma factor n=1 Tax=Rhizobium sp. NPDC090279 TaxID=3364499 RepID=UPI00383ADE79
MHERPSGLFDAQYRAFLVTVSDLRAQLHRYCARMTGSRLDGEDLMQETLFEAYTKIQSLHDISRLKPWLFRIAHNRCIDFLRQRGARERAESAYSDDVAVVAAEPATTDAHRAIERLVGHLPPKERACILLKDVFDYSLEETAELVGSTIGGVKSALSRGRAKLADLPAEPAREPSRPLDPDTARLLQRYVDLFNHHDWDGVRGLTSADARLRVADCFDGQLKSSPYFLEYERNPERWTMEFGTIGGELVMLVLFQRDDRWQVAWPIRVHVAGRVIDRIEDYYACPWVIGNASESDLRFMTGPVNSQGA